MVYENLAGICDAEGAKVLETSYNRSCTSIFDDLYGIFYDFVVDWEYMAQRKYLILQYITNQV